MVFGFTNTRGSNYKPGDTFEPLKNELASNKDVSIGLFENTVYCFDSESFRYLAAYHQGVDLGDRADYNRSWEKSAKESQRSLTYFQDLKPHNHADCIDHQDDGTDPDKVNLRVVYKTHCHNDATPGVKEWLESIRSGDVIGVYPMAKLANYIWNVWSIEVEIYCEL
jgi:hypothetical protein